MKSVRRNGLIYFITLSIALVIILALMTRSLESLTTYSRYYTLLVIAGLIIFLLLVILIIYYIFYLTISVRRKRLGARLNARVMIFFAGLSIAPIVLLFLFSSITLTRGIDSWFDESLDKGFDDSIKLSRYALEVRRLDALEITNNIVRSVNEQFNRNRGLLDLPLSLHQHLLQYNVKELAIFDQQGQVLAASFSDRVKFLPDRPDNVILMTVSQGRDYVELEPLPHKELQVRVVVLASLRGYPKPVIVQALYEIPSNYTDLGLSAQESVEKYKQYKAIRGPLKMNLISLLAMVALLSILLALGGSFFATRRLVNPITRLSFATKSIADGEFDRTIKVRSKDEIGFLTESFNEMILKLRNSHEAEKSSQRKLEMQRAYLASVLEKLSSGVLVIHGNGRIRTFNDAALAILSTTEQEIQSISLFKPESIPVHLESFFAPLLTLLEEEGEQDWRQEISRFHEGAKQILSLRASLQKQQLGLRGGYIIVFDDITQLINSERESAWGEVARRLAHEIKNPLTPIQLSAERLELRLTGKLEPKDQELVEKSAKTIINQVNAMKEMVNAFSQYARAPQLNLVQIDLNHLAEEILFLYEKEPDGVSIHLDLADQPLVVLGDEIRLRQLLHNLVKNAVEASSTGEFDQHNDITVKSELKSAGVAQLSVTDTGIGIDPELMKNMFEPYVTSKAKGTGLGLAVVKKIVEEHNGSITIHQGDNQRGTKVIVTLPLMEAMV